MRRNLPKWCKEAQKALIDNDMTAHDLAKKIGKSPAWVSSILTGRVYSEPAVEVISDVLNISKEYTY